MIPYKVVGYFTDVEFYITTFTNWFLIYLTLFHIKKVTGTYKKMVLMFAFMGLLFSLTEHITRPFAHNYNETVIWFSVSDWINSKKVLQLGILAWIVIYFQVVSFISIQFIYRYFCLFNEENSKKFDGIGGSLLWVFYPFLPGLSFSALFFIFCQPDKNSDVRLRQNIMENYSLNISEVPQFVLVTFSSDGFIRWKDLSILILACLLIAFHYSIIIFCGLKMHFNMSKKLKNLSALQGNIHKQFFRALLVQSIGPTFLLVLPAALLVLTPFVHYATQWEISIQTGWFYAFDGGFPPFDSIAFMLIVAEYRVVIKRKFFWFYGNNSQMPITSVSSEAPPKQITFLEAS